MGFARAHLLRLASGLPNPAALLEGPATAGARAATPLLGRVARLADRLPGWPAELGSLREVLVLGQRGEEGRLVPDLGQLYAVTPQLDGALAERHVPEAVPGGQCGVCLVQAARLEACCWLLGCWESHPAVGVPAGEVSLAGRQVLLKNGPRASRREETTSA